MRALTATILRYAGHQAETASNGSQALEKLDAHRPDLMLLDLTMPEMDGFEVLERLCKRGHGRPPVPVVIFSALDDQATRSRVAELGASGFIAKSASDAEILRQEVALHV
jgi:CheY-like chemotaxis protein